MARATSATFKATGKTYKIKPLTEGRPWKNYKNLASLAAKMNHKFI